MLGVDITKHWKAKYRKHDNQYTNAIFAYVLAGGEALTAVLAAGLAGVLVAVLAAAVAGLAAAGLEEAGLEAAARGAVVGRFLPDMLPEGIAARLAAIIEHEGNIATMDNLKSIHVTDILASTGEDVSTIVSKLTSIRILGMNRTSGSVHVGLLGDRVQDVIFSKLLRSKRLLLF